MAVNPSYGLRRARLAYPPTDPTQPGASPDWPAVLHALRSGEAGRTVRGANTRPTQPPLLGAPLTQFQHGRNGIPRYKAAWLISWRCRVIVQVCPVQAAFRQRDAGGSHLTTRLLVSGRSAVRIRSPAQFFEQSSRFRAIRVPDRLDFLAFLDCASSARAASATASARARCRLSDECR